MEDIEILKNLINGNHLEQKELEQAQNILYLLTMNLKSRVRG